MRLNRAAGESSRAVLARALLVLAALALRALPAAAQNDDPLTPVPPREVHTITRESPPATAPLPPETIIRSFTARADEYVRAHTMYGFKRLVRVQEFTPDGEKGGDLRQESEIYLADNGRRYERATKENSSRFLDVKSASVDVQKSVQVPLFPLTSNQLPFYTLTYKGSQPLDELNTYIFEVKPKALLRGRRLFSGIVYVDDQDLAIVKVYGAWKSIEDEDEDNASTRDVPFSLYEIYYENVSGKYWFPTYIHSDAYVHTKNGDEQLRLTVRMTDFKVTKPVASPGDKTTAPGPEKPASPPPASPAKPAPTGPDKPPA